MKLKYLRWILLILTLVTFGQVIWWAYLLNYHHALLVKANANFPGLQDFHSFQRMIVLESAFFFFIWATFMFFAYRAHKKELQLQNAHHTFLGAISHELKTPLAVIRLSLDTLARPALDSDKKIVYLQRANLATDKLLREVETILQLTAQTALDSKKQPLALNRILKDCIEQIKQIKPNCQFDLEIDLNKDLIVRGTPLESRLVLQNIIENALKYGSGKKIKIFSENLGRKTSLVIKDDGIGMTKDEITNAFQPFWRSDRVVNQAQPGTGMGLTLARELSKKAGIQILLDSDGINKGTTTRIYWEHA